MNYTSQIRQYKEPKSQLDGQLMSQVLAAKDQQYNLAEARLDAAIAQYDNFGIDNPEVKKRYGEELERLVSTIDNANLRDIGKTDIQKRINSALGRMLTPEYLKHNAIHQANKKYEQQVKELSDKDPNNFNLKNYNAAKRLSGYSSYLKSGNTNDVNTELLRYTPFKDIDSEIMKKLKETINLRGKYETYTTDKDGNTVKIEYDNLTPEYLQFAIPNLMSDDLMSQALINGADSLGYSPNQAQAISDGIVDEQIQGFSSALKAKQTALTNLRRHGFNTEREAEIEKEIGAIQDRISQLNQQKGRGVDFYSVARMKGVSDATNRLTQLLSREQPSQTITKHATDKTTTTSKNGKPRVVNGVETYIPPVSQTDSPFNPRERNENEREALAQTAVQRERDLKDNYYNILEEASKQLKTAGVDFDSFQAEYNDHTRETGEEPSIEGLQQYVISRVRKGTIDTTNGINGFEIYEQVDEALRNYESAKSVIDQANRVAEQTQTETLVNNITNNPEALTGIFLPNPDGTYSDQSEQIRNMTADELTQELSKDESPLKAALIGRGFISKNVNNKTYQITVPNNVIYQYQQISKNLGEDNSFLDDYDIVLETATQTDPRTGEVVGTNRGLKINDEIKNISDSNKTLQEKIMDIASSHNQGSPDVRIKLNYNPKDPNSQTAQLLNSLENVSVQPPRSTTQQVIRALTPIIPILGTAINRGETDDFNKKIMQGVSQREYIETLNRAIATNENLRGAKQSTFNGIDKQNTLWGGMVKLTSENTEDMGAMVFQENQSFTMRVKPGEGENANPIIQIEQVQPVGVRDKDLGGTVKRPLPVTKDISYTRALDLLDSNEPAEQELRNYIINMVQDQTAPGSIFSGDVNRTDTNVAFFNDKSPEQMNATADFLERSSSGALLTPIASMSTYSGAVADVTDSLNSTKLFNTPDNDWFKEYIKQSFKSTGNLQVDMNISKYGAPDSNANIVIKNRNTGKVVVNLPARQLSRIAGANITPETLTKIYNLNPAWFYQVAVNQAIFESEDREDPTILEELLNDATATR